MEKEVILAKSRYGKTEELQTHTKKVIDYAEKEINYLESLGYYLNDDFRNILKIVCFVHDLGKVSRTFQESLKLGFDEKKYIPHNLISTVFLTSIFETLKDLHISKKMKNIIVYAVGFHHKNFVQLSHYINRNNKFFSNQLIDEIIDIENNRLHLLESMRELFKQIFNRDVNFSVDYSITENLHKIFDDIDPYDENLIFLKGILHRADHISSADIDEISRFYQKNKPHEVLKRIFTLKKFQEKIAEISSTSTLLTAPTGSGKTLSALSWANAFDGKIIFTLPTRASVNSIYNKLKDYFGSEDVGLLHGDMGRLIYQTLAERFTQEGIHEINLNKNLLKPVIVSTIDQIFSFALRVRYYEKLLVSLFGSKIIIDEIDSYSPYTIEVLKQSLKIAKKYNIKSLIMSATIPDVLTREFQEEGIIDEVYKPTEDELELVSNAKHKIEIIKKDITNCGELIKSLTKKGINSILIVCNTIKKAKKVYETVKKLYETDRDIQKALNYQQPQLYHSLFTFNDREEKEKNIMLKEEKNVSIWITTQVIEVSLDLDFDVLITEICPANVLIQRMGRCYRKRKGIGEVYIYYDSSNKSLPYYPEAVDLCMKALMQYTKKNFDILDIERKTELLNKCFETYWNSSRVINEKNKARYVVNNFLSSDLTLLETISKNEISRFLRDTVVTVSVIPSEIYEIEHSKFDSGEINERTFRYNIINNTIQIPLYTFIKFRNFFIETSLDTSFDVFVTELQYNKEKGLVLEDPSNIF